MAASESQGDIRYAVIVTSKRAANHGETVTREGSRFWVMDEPEGWVEATSTEVRPDDPPGRLLKTFDTEADAHSFGKRWKGHPWWCDPKSYEVVPVRVVMKLVFSHYEIVKQAVGEEVTHV